MRYTIYGKSGLFDAERFIDVMQAFETFITAAKSGGGEELNGEMAELGILQGQTASPFPGFMSNGQPIQTRTALAFLLSDKGSFFREFLLDEVLLEDTFKTNKYYLISLLSYPILRLWKWWCYFLTLIAELFPFLRQYAMENVNKSSLRD